jgi:hypothetical protein
MWISGKINKLVIAILVVSMWVVASRGVRADGNENCVPVYGGGTSCQHVPVDTGFEDDIFYYFAAALYMGGLVAFLAARKTANKKSFRVTVR